MSRRVTDLRRLAGELARLTPSERQRVLREAAGPKGLVAPPRRFSPPILFGGKAWVGGSLRREEIYEEDGR